MTAAVASYPGPYQERSSTPPSRCSYTPPSSVGRGSGALHFGGRPVATPLGLAALWEKEPIGKSAPAPSGPPLHRATHGASWGRGSTSPRRSPGPLMIRAEGSMEHTPRAGFQDSPRGPARRSATPSRLGFPDPKSPEREIRAERAVRQTSQSPRVPTLPGRNEDLIHQHVLYIMRKNPDVARSRKVQQVTEGVYLVDGHEVNIEWKHATEPGQRGCPMVVDGPMHQPLIDYLRYSEENKQYDLETVVCTTALHQVPKDKRMTFDDKHKQYSRLDAMKVAKEQACIREQAADYTLDGKQVPNELVRRYNKALRSKVRGSRKDDRVILAQEQEPAPHAGQPSPPVPAPVLAPPVPAPVLTQPKQPKPQAQPAQPAQPQAQSAKPKPQAQPPQAQPPQAQPQLQVREVRAEVKEAVKAEFSMVRQPSPAAMRMAAQAMAATPGRSSPPVPEPAPRPFPTAISRGISLNGVPSYVPGPVATAVGSWQPPVVTRSWSGCLTPREVAPTGFPQAQVLTAPLVVRQVSVGHAEATAPDSKLRDGGCA
ncbi:unnamed protein product [Effrenium voratum]|nr:unnamed protein product [Effrenium voratum]